MPRDDWKKARQDLELRRHRAEAATNSPTDSEQLDLRQAQKAKVVIRARHILVPFKEVCERLKQSIEQGEQSFSDAAAKHSLCPSGQEGGDLGQFKPAQMVPEFARAVVKAPLNQVQGPIKTQFGFHLIEVLERFELA